LRSIIPFLMVFLISMGSATVGWSLMGRAQSVNRVLRDTVRAQMLVRELDGRASELKVDAYKAMLRSQAADESAEFAQDVETIVTRLDALETLALTPTSATVVPQIGFVYRSYIQDIATILNDAIVNQPRAAAAFADVQTANDRTDAAALGFETVIDDQAGWLTARGSSLQVQGQEQVIVVVLADGLAFVILLWWVRPGRAPSSAGRVHRTGVRGEPGFEEPPGTGSLT